MVRKGEGAALRAEPRYDCEVIDSDAPSLNSAPTANISIDGHEANPTTWCLARMNLAIRGINGNLGPEHADSRHHGLDKDLNADCVLVNPPFDMCDWGADRRRNGARWPHGASLSPTLGWSAEAANG